MTTTQAPAGLTATQEKALAALAEHGGATAREIAAYAGIGGSTAGKALTVLESHNLAYREHGEKVGGRRTADRWYHRPVEAELEGPGADEAPVEAPADDATPDEPVATETAQAPAAEPDGAPAEEATPAPVQKAKASARLARGGLRQMVYEYLEAHPDEAVTAPRLAKALGRSAGAVANALVKLTGQGQAELIGESPRRYRLAGQ
ncbi:helix-turn-helix domain-containing protein [Streptomyces javensis]|uniref:MarR family transcriptional regulator n=1 Tax=Streptomyces javensis TaxID=114698 RepID=A0ABS0RQZ5_9ACTN|nr:MarR family transcriptional regulator [Streptomyces javensis]MBI0319111.1 MarR family transcriptional regulator [Streptomyces javensis]